MLDSEGYFDSSNESGMEEAEVKPPEEDIGSTSSKLLRSQRKRKLGGAEKTNNTSENDTKVLLPESQAAVIRVRKIPRKKNLKKIEKCSICEQDEAKISFYNAHPQYAVEEWEAIQDERISDVSGKITDRRHLNITGFSIYDVNGHLCPIVPNRVGKNRRIYISGYLNSLEADIEEESVPVKDVGPIIHCYIRFDRRSLKLIVTLCTELADYNLLTPSAEYTPIMNNFNDKWYVLNILLMFLRDSYYIQHTYEELLSYIKMNTIPGYNEKLSEEILHKHAEFICDQVVNFENEQYLTSVHCLTELMRYCNSKLVAENVNKMVYKKVAYTKATTTPLVRGTFENLFTDQLDEINCEQYLGRKTRQLPDSDNCRAIPTLGGCGRSNKQCTKVNCLNVRNLFAEECEPEGEPFNLPNDVAVEITREKKIIWIGEPVKVDLKETYYEKVKIDGVEFSVGDYVSIKNTYPDAPALVGKMTYLWKDNTTKIGYFHTEIFTRAAFTIVGEIGDSRELFAGDRCHNVQLLSIVEKVIVERRDKPKDWPKLAENEVHKEVNQDSGKTFFYQKYYQKSNARFEDLPDDLSCPNNLRKHRYCPTCERKIRQDIKELPIAFKRIRNYGSQKALKSEYKAVRWQGDEYKKGNGVFLDPKILKFKKPKRRYRIKKIKSKEVDENMDIKNNNLHGSQKSEQSQESKATRSRNIKERITKIENVDKSMNKNKENNKLHDPQKHKQNDINNATRSRSIEKNKCKEVNENMDRKNDNLHDPQKSKKNKGKEVDDNIDRKNDNLHDPQKSKQSQESKTTRSRNIKKRKTEIENVDKNMNKHKENDKLHSPQNNINKGKRSRNLKKSKNKVVNETMDRKNDNLCHPRKPKLNQESKTTRSRNIKKRKTNIENVDKNMNKHKKNNKLHNPKNPKKNEINTTRSCNIKKSKEVDGYMHRKNDNLRDPRKLKLSNESKTPRSRIIKKRKTEIENVHKNLNKHKENYKLHSPQNDINKSKRSRNLKKSKNKVVDETRKNDNLCDPRKPKLNQESKTTPSRNIKKRKTNIENVDKNTYPVESKKKDNNLYDFKKTSENTQSRNKRKRKCRIVKVNDNMYPESSRKNNILLDHNIVKNKPFCVGYIVAVVVARDGEFVCSDDIYLRVKVMFRPENTTERFPQRADVNMVYWSEEIVEVPFRFVEGPCHLVYVDNIPRQTSIHEWLEEDPNRIYFRQSYNRKGRFEEVPEHAKRVGRKYRKMSKCDEKCSLTDNIAENREVHTRPLRTLDVFAGCGGLSEGLHRAGVAECKWAIENQPAEALAYSLNNERCIVFNEDCNTLLQAAMRGDTHSEQGLLLPRPGEVELLCGGPPCQGFSGMNRYNAGDCSSFKNSLVATLLSYCDYYRPNYFVLENVRNFAGFKKGMVLKLTVQALLEMGYQCTFGVLQAGDYGVPQARRRLFLLAAAPGCRLPVFPEPWTTFTRQSSSLAVTIDGKRFSNGVHWKASAPRRTCTVYDAISDLPPICNGADDILIDYGCKPKTHFQRSVRSQDETEKLCNHVTKNMAPLAHARICHIPTKPGSDWRDLPNIEVALTDGTKCEVLKYRYEVKKRQKRGRPGGGARRSAASETRRGVCACASGNKCAPSDRQDNTLIPWCLAHTADRHNNWAGLYGRNSWHGFFSTLVTNPEPMGKQGRVLHPTQHRVLSVREYARAQGFPDSYHFAGAIKQKYRQIGNAVPPPMAKAIGIEIKKAILAQRRETVPVLSSMTFLDY